jgi:pimeloyl-ACP methyl ester carboxylesterase
MSALFKITAVATIASFATVGCAEFQRRDERLQMPASASGQRMTVASSRRMYVEARGAGPLTPVLFVHGFASNRETWTTIEPTLRAQRRTVAVDLPGFGLSDRFEGDYSPEALADDLASVLTQLNIAQCDIVAHSWGSSVTLAFALRHPARVRRLVLIGAWVFEEQIPPFFRWAREPGVGEGLFGLFYAERLDDRAGLGFAAGTEVSQQTVDSIERSLERPGTVRAALAAVRGQYFVHLEQQYHRVTASTLVVYGDEDRVALPRYGARLANELPAGRYVSVPRAGHFPMFESAGTVRALVEAFLADPATAQSPSTSQSALTPATSATVYNSDVNSRAVDPPAPTSAPSSTGGTP